ncbi:MAG: tungstate transport system ATP-binding protein [Gammaproteobacteria bacterium]|jgi:tungstate transport system ATP-binding protein
MADEHGVDATSNSCVIHESLTLPVRVENLVYEIDKARIIDSLNLELSAGGCTAILGYNGAGKSVFLRLLHGLLTPSSGTIQWAGNFAVEFVRQRQSMVFQAPVLLRRSIEANVRYASTKRGFKGDLRAQRIETVLQQTNLSHIRHRHATVLSGGERQRVAIARALAVEPEILFLDEPTASLDPAATIGIEDILVRARNEGRKLIMVTQSVGQAARLANDVVFMHRGQIEEHSSIDDFLAAPQSPVAQAFIEGKLYQ